MAFFLHTTLQTRRGVALAVPTALRGDGRDAALTQGCRVVTSRIGRMES